MLVFTVQPDLLVIVIEVDNLERMIKSDPITLESGVLDGFLPTLESPNRMRLIIAYESDSKKLYEIIRTGNIETILDHLTRGYKFTDVDGKLGTVPAKAIIQ